MKRVRKTKGSDDCALWTLFNITEVYTYGWLGYWILCYGYFTTIKNFFWRVYIKISKKKWQKEREGEGERVIKK